MMYYTEHMQDFRFKYNVNNTYMVTGYQGDEAIVSVPETFYGLPVTMLYDDLFKHHAEIREIRLPSTLTDIGGFVFDGCTSLDRIIIPDTVSVLWQYAFVRSSIKDIRLPDSLKSVYPFTFKDCRELREVICGPELKEISAWAFQGCISLHKIRVSLHTKIDGRAFDGCNKITIEHY